VTATSRAIPSLDGLRAVSVAMVIFAHAVGLQPGRGAFFPFPQLSWLGQSGVDVFFVISGFLITYLLVRENEAKGKISLKNFYFRRFFRIFPPFYVYLAVVIILWSTGMVAQHPRDVVSAATYTWDYRRNGQDWLLGHTWSLSVEEQFYLVWPPCLLFLSKKSCTYLALGAILLSPISRALTYFLVPSWRGAVGIMFHTRLDTIMFGCALALLWKEERFNRWADKLLNPLLFTFSVVYILILAPCLSARFEGRYEWPVGYTLRGLFISIVLLYVVRKPISLPGRILNLGFLRHVGIISYSLYLWQQMFTGPYSFLFPLNIFAIFACAELSYFLVERPSLGLRDMIGARLMKAPAISSRSREAGVT
jgi:peptidoglycan/LPS O-acetylase OafA/YrhL